MTTHHLDALRSLRSLYVAARRERVAESLHFAGASGNERRFIEIADAIAAIDAAIRDEESLACRGEVQLHLVSEAASFRVANAAEVAAAANGAASHLNGDDDPVREPAWPTYEDWLKSHKVVRDAAAHSGSAPQEDAMAAFIADMKGRQSTERKRLLGV